MERLAGHVILLWGWRRALLAVAAGAFAALAQAPVDFFAAGFVSFTLLVWLIDGTGGGPGFGRLAAPRSAFAIGWCFGFGYFLAGLYWTGGALLVEADLFAWALPLVVVGFPAGLAIFHGLAAMLARLVWSDGLGRIAALALAFGALEWLRATVLTGFPWNTIGYAAMPIPLLMQSVAAVGLFGVTALAVFVFAMPALAAAPLHRRAGALLAVVLVAAHVGFGQWRLSQAEAAEVPTLDIRIVQPSVDQGEKWDRAERDRIFSRLIELSALPGQNGSPKPGIVVWPETAFPFLLTERPDALTALSELLGDDGMLLAGAVRVEGGPGDARYYNSILAINHDGEIADAYDKVHLVPFGEYLPLAGLLGQMGIGHLASAFPEFAAGGQRRLMALPSGAAILPFICYEIIFPGLGRSQADEANLLLNVTNDAWFGDSPGPYQHFRQAQLRAVETGLPLVRAANNGISGAVDAHGRVIDAFAVDAVGVIDVSLPLQRAQRLGDFGQPAAFGILAIILLASGLGRAGRRN